MNDKSHCQRVKKECAKGNNKTYPQLYKAGTALGVIACECSIYRLWSHESEEECKTFQIMLYFSCHSLD